jgi:mono/diheme cytochrome c family protein
MRYGLLLISLFGIFLIGCQSSNTDNSSSASQDERNIGRDLYVQYCAACHGATGAGQFPDDPYAPDASGRVGAPPHDSTGHTWHHPDAVLVKIVQEGRAMPNVHPMPPFGSQLTESQILAIFDHIKTWWLPEQVESQATTSANYTPSAP